MKMKKKKKKKNKASREYRIKNGFMRTNLRIKRGKMKSRAENPHPLYSACANNQEVIIMSKFYIARMLLDWPALFPLSPQRKPTLWLCRLSMTHGPMQASLKSQEKSKWWEK
jgi:hypothetical protein